MRYHGHRRLLLLSAASRASVMSSQGCFGRLVCDTAVAICRHPPAGSKNLRPLQQPPKVANSKCIRVSTSLPTQPRFHIQSHWANKLLARRGALCSRRSLLYLELQQRGIVYKSHINHTTFPLPPFESSDSRGCCTGVYNLKTIVTTPLNPETLMGLLVFPVFPVS